eukprot:Selendium_serpulae@DN6225_c0_g2_i1.p1
MLTISEQQKLRAAPAGGRPQGGGGNGKNLPLGRLVIPVKNKDEAHSGQFHAHSDSSSSMIEHTNTEFFSKPLNRKVRLVIRPYANECRLMFSGTEWQKLSDEASVGDTGLTSQVIMNTPEDVAKFIAKVRTWWQQGFTIPFQEEFAIKILYRCNFNINSVRDALKDPSFDLETLSDWCDPPMRPYENKWESKQKRADICRVPYNMNFILDGGAAMNALREQQLDNADRLVKKGRSNRGASAASQLGNVQVSTARQQQMLLMAANMNHSGLVATQAGLSGGNSQNNNLNAQLAAQQNRAGNLTVVGGMNVGGGTGRDSPMQNASPAGEAYEAKAAADQLTKAYVGNIRKIPEY